MERHPDRDNKISKKNRGGGRHDAPTADMKHGLPGDHPLLLVDREGEIFQGVFLQPAAIGQSLQGGVQTGFQRIITLA